MILTCPSCGTRFALDAARLGAEGRTVRCARCSHTWFAEPAAAAPVTAGESAAADEPRLRPGDRPLGPPRQAFEDNQFAGRFRNQADDGETRNLPALIREGRLGALVGWGGLVLFLIMVSAGVVLFARDITTAWPAAATLYDRLGLDPDRSLLSSGPAAPVAALPLEKRLRFTALAPSQRFIDGVLTLVISGRIESTSAHEEILPPIEVVLLDNQKLDLKTQVFAPPQPSLKPGAEVAFETRFENPPPEAQDIRVTFSSAAKSPGPADKGK